MQSKDLTDFYLDYKQWLDMGAPSGNPFWRHCGLCNNLSVWVHGVGLKLSAPLRREMEAQFTDAGLSYMYPFNDKGTDYTDECNSAQVHLNDRRNQWVNSHLS